MSALSRLRRRRLRLDTLEDRTTPTIDLGAIEVRANTYSTNEQRYSSIAADSNNHVVVVWESKDQSVGYDIYAQRFNSAGSTVGSEFRINATTTGDQRLGNLTHTRKVAMDANGKFVVVWQLGHSGSSTEVFHRRYNADGTQIATDSRVNVTTTNEQYQPSIAMNANGEYVVTWVGFGGSGPLYGVYARKYTAAGAGGAEIQVNAPASSPFGPSVAIGPSGNFVVTWQEADNIYARRYDAAGSPQGGVFTVSSGLGEDYPTVAMDDSGSFIITWTRGSFTTADVYARRYAADGTPLGSAFLVNTTTNDRQERSSVSAKPNGDFVISWWGETVGDPIGNQGGAVARAFFASGAPNGDEVRLNNNTAGVQENVGTALRSDGSLVATWWGLGPNGNGDSLGDVFVRIGSVPSPGLTLSINPSSVSENAGSSASTGTVTRTNADTASALVVNLSSNDTSEATVPTTVTIPIGQVSTTFPIDAVDDTGYDGAQSVNISASASGHGSANASMTVTDFEPNNPPSFIKGPDQIDDEDDGEQTVLNWATNISPGPPEESSQIVHFEVIGNTNTSLFEVSPVVSPTGTLTYKLAANAFGAATITLTLVDDGGTDAGGQNTSAQETFTISVNSANDPPSFTKGSDEVGNEDAGPQTVENWATALSAGPANESGQVLDFLVSNNNGSLFAVAPAIDADGTLTYTPADDAHGLATVTVRIHDNGGGTDTSAAETFAISVDAVNDPPSFTKGPDEIVDEDAGQQTVENWATALDAGPANETGQLLDFLVSNNNSALFSQAPTIDDMGKLSYTAANDANGSATVTVQIHDNGGGTDTSAAQTFTINVNAMNDVPSFTGGSNILLNEDPGPQSISGWATAISKGPANESSQTISFEITSNSNPALFASGPTVTADGTLLFATTPNAFGTATIELEVSDDGGGSNIGNTHSFTIEILPENDAPIAQADNVSVKVGKIVTIPVLANDSDVELGTLQLLSVTTPTHGTVRIVGNTLVYTPKIIKGAVDTFNYSVSDGQGGTSVGTVSVTILDVTPPKIQAVRLYYGLNDYIDASAVSRSIVAWERLYKVAVVFSEEVLANPTAMTFMRHGVAVPTTFTWDLATRTATWTPVVAIADGRTTIRLSASGVVDTSGNLLAKDWVRAFGLLAGDFDGNGIVNKADLKAIKKRFTKPKVALARLADVDGNGIVNQADLDMATANLGKRLK